MTENKAVIADYDFYNKMIGLLCVFFVSLSAQEFSMPSITLFGKSGFRGRKVVLTDAFLNLSLAGIDGRVSSLLVNGGM